MARYLTIVGHFASQKWWGEGDVSKCGHHSHVGIDGDVAPKSCGTAFTVPSQRVSWHGESGAAGIRIWERGHVGVGWRNERAIRTGR
jgi:hypothetical protein